MPGDDIHQPHDKLFKAGFGEPANAAAFLRVHLPEAISSAVDWGRLRLENASFTD